jgi:hypothetical protein
VHLTGPLYVQCSVRTDKPGNRSIGDWPVTGYRLPVTVPAQPPLLVSPFSSGLTEPLRRSQMSHDTRRLKKSIVTGLTVLRIHLCHGLRPRSTVAGVPGVPGDRAPPRETGTCQNGLYRALVAGIRCSIKSSSDRFPVSWGVPGDRLIAR